MMQYVDKAMDCIATIVSEALIGLLFKLDKVDDALADFGSED